MIRTRSTQASQDLCEVRCVDAGKVQRLRKEMKLPTAVGALAETFRVLGDPTRLRIVFALSREELCVCDLAALLDVSQSVVSHSLRALRQMQLVRYRKVGKVAYYALDDEHIASLVSEGFRHAEERGQPHHVPASA
jgi:ArsR family transcriptional regulator, lead/cadmium/zinc/bismuth-responsive transcriptional repressor